MSQLGKPLFHKKFRCKVKRRKCKVCKKVMLIKTNNLHGYGQVYSKNRVTCSKECSRINLDNIRIKIKNKEIKKRKLLKFKQNKRKLNKLQQH